MGTRGDDVRKRREERKAKAGELQAAIAEQVAALTESDRWLEFLRFAQAFHSYSLNNVLLILRQNPEASQVAGFKKWQTLGRQVRKGETALRIFGYATQKIADADEDAGTKEKRRVYFPVLSVFDVSQTDVVEGGGEIPEIAVPLTGADEHGIFEAARAYITGIGWHVAVEQIERANGYATNDGSQRIVIKDSLDPAAAAKTILHETAHALMHCSGGPAADAEERARREVEAESVAYIVAGAVGLDTSSYSIDYIASWSQADATIITEVAGNVLRTAHTIIEALTPEAVTEEEAA